MWARLKKFFKHSETIAWARFQSLVGVIMVSLTYLDPSLVEPLFEPEIFPYFLIANALATEYLRRRRDPEMGTKSPDND